MTYRFRGFFADGDESLLDAAKEKWPGALGKVIETPFSGIGVTVLDLSHQGRFGHENEYKDAMDLSLRIESELPAWSAQYPDLVFVFLDTDCWGGDCENEGFVCSGGQVVARESGDGALSRLLSHLNIVMDKRECFDPLTRDYFSQCLDLPH